MITLNQMKKYLPHILLALAIIDLIFLLYLFTYKEELGISTMHPVSLGCGVAFILLFMTAAVQWMKKMDEED